ncbi:MAG: copper amine oxidase N-terminal domain-containing protein [Armatimonadota bacterium]
MTRRRIPTVVVLVALAAGAAHAADGLFFRTLPTIINGRAMVPLRPIARWLNASVQYEQGVIWLTKPPTIRVRLQVGSTTATRAGSEFVLDAAPTIVDGTVMVPLRFVGDAFGAWVTSKPGRQIELALPQEKKSALIAMPPSPQSHLGKMYRVMSYYFGLRKFPDYKPEDLRYFNLLSKRWQEQLTAEGAKPIDVEKAWPGRRKVAGLRVVKDHFDGSIEGWAETLIKYADGAVEHKRVRFVREPTGWKVDRLEDVPVG